MLVARKSIIELRVGGNVGEWRRNDPHYFGFEGNDGKWELSKANTVEGTGRWRDDMQEQVMV